MLMYGNPWQGDRGRNGKKTEILEEEGDKEDTAGKDIKNAKRPVYEDLITLE